MQSILELFPALLQDHLDRPEIQQELVKIAWKHCVGRQIGEVSSASSFQNGTLRVDVVHSQWKNILTSMKADIIARMNKYLTRPIVKDIQIRIV
jgi:predicted nucleic acid-binding Zn ribbon protein